MCAATLAATALPRRVRIRPAALVAAAVLALAVCCCLPLAATALIAWSSRKALAVDWVPTVQLAALLKKPLAMRMSMSTELLAAPMMSGGLW